jgi:hypothetical protein
MFSLVVTHGVKDITLGFNFINIHLNCAVATILPVIGLVMIVVLHYAGYRHFCHRDRAKKNA